MTGEQDETSATGAAQETAPVVTSPVVTLENYHEHYNRLVVLSMMDPAPGTRDDDEYTALFEAIYAFEKARYG